MTQNRFSFKVYRRNQHFGHIHLGLLDSRTVGQYIFVAVSCLVCGNLLRQTSETNMPSLYDHLPVVFLASKHPISSCLWSSWHPACCFQGCVMASQRELSHGKWAMNLERRFWDWKVVIIYTTGCLEKSWSGHGSQVFTQSCNGRLKGQRSHCCRAGEAHTASPRPLCWGHYCTYREEAEALRGEAAKLVRSSLRIWTLEEQAYLCLFFLALPCYFLVWESLFSPAPDQNLFIIQNPV